MRLAERLRADLDLLRLRGPRRLQQLVAKRRQAMTLSFDKGFVQFRR
jgi:hypothetical protein